MKLFVMRHGDAGAYSTDPKKERERGLTSLGQRVVTDVADMLIKLDQVPTLIFASPFARAVETADILGKRMKISVNVVGDLAPDRPIENAILQFMAHKELKNFGIVGHKDNTTPAFDKFGGDMGDWVKKGDKDLLDGKKALWPTLAKGEVRRLAVHREFGFWQCKLRISPSDLGYDDDYE